MSLISVLAVSFVRNGTGRKVVKFVSGLLILLVAAQPLLHLGDIRIDSYFSDMGTYDAQEAQTRYRERLAEHIRTSSESYIEQKAAALGAMAQVNVDVTDGNPPTPCSVTVIGTMTPAQADALSAYIIEAFAIPKEKQEWKLYE